MLKIDKVSTSYGKKQVLFDVSFEVKKGEIALLIGSNGSGKSTLLKSIYGLMRSINDSSGIMWFNDLDITNSKPSDLIQKGLYYIPQKNNCFENLTVKENLEISGLSLNNKNIFNQRYEKVLNLFPILYKFNNQYSIKLSGGEKQILAVSMALIHEPKMILMDEPFAGLSQQYIQIVKDIILKLNKSKETTFLIVEHKVKESIFFSNRILGLKLGKIFKEIIIDNNFKINELNSIFI